MNGRFRKGCRTEATLATGMALIAPNLSSLIFRRGGPRAGAALGLQSAANSLGQAGGPIVGGALFIWRSGAPYALAGLLMFCIAIATASAEHLRSIRHGLKPGGTKMGG